MGPTVRGWPGRKPRTVSGNAADGPSFYALYAASAFVAICFDRIDAHGAIAQLLAVETWLLSHREIQNWIDQKGFVRPRLHRGSGLEKIHGAAPCPRSRRWGLGNITDCRSPIRAGTPPNSPIPAAWVADLGRRALMSRPTARRVVFRPGPPCVRSPSAPLYRQSPRLPIRPSAPSPRLPRLSSSSKPYHAPARRSGVALACPPRRRPRPIAAIRPGLHTRRSGEADPSPAMGHSRLAMSSKDPYIGSIPTNSPPLFEKIPVRRRIRFAIATQVRTNREIITNVSWCPSGAAAAVTGWICPPLGGAGHAHPSPPRKFNGQKPRF